MEKRKKVSESQEVTKREEIIPYPVREKFSRGGKERFQENKLLAELSRLNTRKFVLKQRLAHEVNPPNPAETDHINAELAKIDEALSENIEANLELIALEIKKITSDRDYEKGEYLKLKEGFLESLQKELEERKIEELGRELKKRAA